MTGKDRQAHNKLRAQKSARAWYLANKECKRATAIRDKKFWKFLERVVRYIKESKHATAKELLAAVQEIAPHLDARGRSRYAKIAGKAATLWPEDEALRDWVKTKGGIAAFGSRNLR